MSRGSVGVIFGETGTLEFKFLVSESTPVHRGEYVKAWHESDGWILAQVILIKRYSEKYTLKEAKNGLRKDKSGDNIVAEATVIGNRDSSGLLRAPTIPFSPGDPIYKADDELINSVLGLSGKKDMNIGLLEGTNIPVNLSVNSLVQRHCSILAKTGSGKSYTAGVVLEELLDNNVPLLIIDPHSEYASLKDPGSEKQEDLDKYNISPKGYGSDITIYTPANKAINPVADEAFRLNGNNLTVKELTSIFPESYTSTHVGILYEAVQKLRSEMDTYTIDDIIFEVGNDKSKAKWNVINLLESVRDSEILSTTPTPIEDLLQKGKASVIDLKGVSPDLQRMIVAELCSSLFEARKMDNVPPGMLVIEEAHNFAPEKGFSKSPSSEVLRNIASEGRKFGLGMMVISQRPARVDKNVLSQCGTQIIMKVTNPNDLKSISKGLEGVNSYVEDELIRLPQGVSMLVSTDIEKPVLVDIRVRKSQHGGKSVNVLKGKQKKQKSKETKQKQSPPPKKTPSEPSQPSADTGGTSAPKQSETPEQNSEDKGGLFKKIFGANK
ncbi:ATP-binding protein [Methanohalobium sp.]|uniref:helicase HerA domain-containing protein n=1 Tax=Methanohalobium sp. TaxID=2837493 RepID=UPI0025E180DC|nr:ATP-binding protein [Methanohalobium sp.]